MENLAYALTQALHNLGAVAVVGGAVVGVVPAPRAEQGRRLLAWLVLAGWLLQAASGVGFGAVSYAFYGKTPDISAIATGALTIKVASAALGLVLVVGMILTRRTNATVGWWGLAVLGLTALTSAAFLRWFA